LDGSVLLVRARTPQIGRIARVPEVAAIQERLEFALSNSEVPTVLMIGTYDQGFGGARPYHDLGIDGGGIDTGTSRGSATTPDGQRLNDGSDAVPPQLVAVTDNGISYDAVAFSQTATQTETLDNLVGTMFHRKVHAIQTVEDSGATCDGLLSGRNTHGNVVAGVIAANPGELGFRYSKAFDPATGAPLRPVSMDALARGARIIMQDAAGQTRCTANEIVETGGSVNPGPLLDRLSLAICPKQNGTGPCAGVVGGGNEVHLHVMPFGVPNFDNIQYNPENGAYTLESRHLDLFLVNNRDYMVFSPVGNQGFARAGFEVQWPDLFDGTAADNDPNLPRPPQIPPPATAKNVVTVGGTWADPSAASDIFTQELVFDASSKGPATPASLRTAPIVMSVASDGSAYFGYPLYQEPATVRSSDNDNLAPVENQIDDQNFGTSFAAGYVAAAGAIVRDYFAQGFYPTGARADADRNPAVSGSLVRAALVAGTDFAEEFNEPPRVNANDQTVARSRAVDMGTIGGVPVGVIGNNNQGYGRVVLSYVVPLPNYPATRGTGRRTIEFAAAGLIVHDMLGTGEPPIDNTTPVSCASGAGCTEKTFTVAGLEVEVIGTA
ncbi:hypothetical protein, partial [Actinokineospora sp.]|uniref:hypothetical protein n=1 Tax=Actinokineospora sp. TaxID=1872133 RepID=UPI003D6B91AA